jgi:FlgD Ig-like domain
LQRILSTAVLVGLLAATAAAFAITERLKLTKSPITGTVVVRGYVSPPAHTTAAVNVRFRRADRVTVTIENSHRSEVDTLAYRVLVPRGRRTYTWNGRDDAGATPPDGTYRMEIHLARQRRTILLPNPIVLETKAPEVTAAVPSRAAFSPDGDHQADQVAIRYTLSEDAHVIVSFRGKQIIRGRAHRTKGAVTWGGRVDGRLLPPGRYVLTIGAVDLAGNRATAVRRVSVRLRYIALAAHRVVVHAGGRLRVGVSTDAKRFHWTLGARKGIASGGELRLRAPGSRGRYRLTVTEHGHSATASVIVR